MLKKAPKTAVLFIIAAIVCSIFRYLQYSTVIKIDKGFFEANGGFLNASYYLLIGIAAVLTALFAIADKKKGNSFGVIKARPSRLSSKDASTGGIFFTLTGVFYGYEAVKIFLNLQNARISNNIFRDLFNDKAVSADFLAFLIVGAAFVALGYAFFVKKRLLPSGAMALIFISAYGIFSGAREFMQNINIANVSSRLIVLLICLASAAFFISCGKAFVRSGSYKSRKALLMPFVFGYTAALLIFSDSFARIIYYLSLDKSAQNYILSLSVLNGFKIPDPYMLLEGCAILWLIYALSYRKREKDETVFKTEIPQKEYDDFPETEIEINDDKKD